MVSCAPSGTDRLFLKAKGTLAYMAKKKSQHVSAKREDYLEAILGLLQETGAARVRDIAAQVGVHKSTVTAALKALAGQGLVNYVPYELVTLTDSGRRIAEDVTRRHSIIKNFLEDVLQVDHAVAEDTACRMEHAMDERVLQRLVLFAEFMTASPAVKSDWEKRFTAFVRDKGKR